MFYTFLFYAWQCFIHDNDHESTLWSRDLLFARTVWVLDMGLLLYLKNLSSFGQLAVLWLVLIYTSLVLLMDFHTHFINIHYALGMPCLLREPINHENCLKHLQSHWENDSNGFPMQLFPGRSMMNSVYNMQHFSAFYASLRWLSISALDSEILASI